MKTDGTAWNIGTALLRHLALWPDTLETATEELNPTAITALHLRAGLPLQQLSTPVPF